MADTNELDRVLADLQRTTGLRIKVDTASTDEIEQAVTRLKQLTHAYKEKYNTNYFLQKLLLGEIASSELHSRAKKMHLKLEEKKALFVLETKSTYEEFVPEILKQLFPSISGNYILAMDTHTICILVGNLGEDETTQTAHMIVDTLSAEAMTAVHLTYAKELMTLDFISDAYREAALTLQIAKLFYPEKVILPSNELGIGRLICTLPTNLCEEFLSEIFAGQLPTQFDEELTATINTFFQTNLNIAETSRQLHVHRNTLIYRLEQLEKNTGLDIRKFEDAMTFKIATMVMNYLQAQKE